MNKYFYLETAKLIEPLQSLHWQLKMAAIIGHSLAGICVKFFSISSGDTDS